MTKLERASNVVLLGTCLVVGSHFAKTMFFQPSPPSIPTDYKTGDKIRDRAGLDLGSAKRTILLVTQSHCHFCSASMPFYQRLSAVSKSGGLRLVGVAAESIEDNRKYLSSNGVIADNIVSAQDSSIRFRGTPTLILVGNDGSVIKEWTGVLDSSSEQDVMTKALHP